MKVVSVDEMIAAWEADELPTPPVEIKGYIVAKHCSGEVWAVPP